MGDWARPIGIHKGSSCRGCRTVAPAHPTSRGSSSLSGTSKLLSDGDSHYHRQQAKHRLTEINSKLAEAKHRLGRLTQNLNTLRDLERLGSSSPRRNSQAQRNSEGVCGTQIPRILQRVFWANTPRRSTTAPATWFRTGSTCLSSTEKLPSSSF